MKKTGKCCICNDKYKEYGYNPTPIKTNGRCCNNCYYDKVYPAKTIADKNNAIKKLEHLWELHKNEESLIQFALFHWKEIFEKGVDDSCWSTQYYELFNLLDFENRFAEAYAATMTHWMYMEREGGFDHNDSYDEADIEYIKINITDYDEHNKSNDSNDELPF